MVLWQWWRIQTKRLIYEETSRSSQESCSIKKAVLKNLTKFTGKHLCQNLFSNKVAGLSSATLLKKRLWQRCFPLNFAKFLRKSFLQNTSRGLLLAFMKAFMKSLHYKECGLKILLTFLAFNWYKESIPEFREYCIEKA